MPERVRTRFESPPAVKVSESKDKDEDGRGLDVVAGKGAVKSKKRDAEAAFADPGRDRDRDRDRRSGIQNGVQRNKIVNFHDDLASPAGPASTPRAVDKQPRLKQRAADLLDVRQKLPIYPHAAEIQQRVRDHDVLLLVGETGSGKSTQVPQFLVDAAWCRRISTRSGAKVGGCIAITQPRRVAAISLARRVAEEMGSLLGSASPASTVGYSVRFDSSVGPSTRIKFLTEGMLLQEMLRDPSLKEYSAVVVDEVHERSVNVDLVLGFLRRLQQSRNESDGRGGVGLKVVVMSATADMDRIEKFFSSTPVSSPSHSISAAPNGDTLNGRSETEEWSGFSEDEAQELSSGINKHKDLSAPKITSCYIKGRQYPVKIHYALQPVPDLLDAALHRIIHIHTHSPLPGDVLVFLTGQETVESLETLCHHYSASLAKDKYNRLPKLQVLPLFAALSNESQQRVFQPTPPFTRKIILSTNIAETSVTVPGVRHVIDTGKRKARHFRPSLNLESLLVKAVSRSSANQRSGRAGRDAPGECYRLYTETEYLKLAADTEPEILRCDLSQLVLTLKAHGVDSILDFPLLTPPPRRSLERALVHLLQLNSLDRITGSITELGRAMSRLPLPAALARILLASQEPQYDCAAEIIDIVSAMSVENVFLPIHAQAHSLEAEDEDASQNPILAARSSLFRREGDHLTLLSTVQAYTADQTSDRKSWCNTHGVSHRAMKSVMDVRKQLTSLMTARTKSSRKDVHHSSTSLSDSPQSDRSTLAPRILRCLLTGLHPNVARPSPAASSSGSGSAYATLLSNQPVSIHPSSVLFRQRQRARDGEASPGFATYEAIMFSEFVFTTKPYARGVSAVQMDWLEDVLREGRS